MTSMNSTQISQAYLDEYNGAAIEAVTIVLIILITVAVALRFLARRLQSATWGWDDFLMIPSWLTCLAVCICSLVNLQYGGARHIEYLELHPEWIPSRGTIDLYVQSGIFCAAVAFPKLSILVLYLRIFTDRFSRIVCWILTVITSILAAVNIFVIAFQCNPRSKAWNPVEPGFCTDIEAHFIWGTFPNFVTDFVMLLLPLPVVYRLHAPLRVKIGIFATFCVGSIGMITSIIRFTEYFNIQFVDNDQPWHDNPLSIWVMVEPCTYLISGCMLSYRVLFRTLAQTSFVSTIYTWLHRSSHYTSYDGRDSSQRTNKRTVRESADLKTTSADRLPFAGANESQWNAVAERGEVMELEPSMSNTVHIRQDFEVSA